MMTANITERQVVAQSERTIVASVVAKCLEADRVVSFTLEPSDGTPFPSWSAGAHVDVELRDGLVRQYSLCGDHASQPNWRIAVLREVDGRGGSDYMHEQVSEGDLLTLRGPRNNFQLDDADEYLFIAGGIGITPILAMVREAANRGKPWKLLYGGRSLASMAF